MTAAVFGLIGVIVGGILNAATTAFLQRRIDRSNERSAARLVRSELVRFRSLAVAAGHWAPDQLPQLHDIAPVLWQSERAVLAGALSDDDWSAVAHAYAHVDALASVLVFEADGGLEAWRIREAERVLAGMLDPVEEAATILGRVAGLRVDQLGDLPEFPEAGPVTA